MLMQIKYDINMVELTDNFIKVQTKIDHSSTYFLQGKILSSSYFIKSSLLQVKFFDNKKSLIEESYEGLTFSTVLNSYYKYIDIDEEQKFNIKIITPSRAKYVEFSFRKWSNSSQTIFLQSEITLLKSGEKSHAAIKIKLSTKINYKKIFDFKVDVIFDFLPGRDYIYNAEMALKNLFVLPYISDKIDFSHGYDFSLTNVNLHAKNSVYLWLHSLPYIYDLCLAWEKNYNIEYLKKAVEVFNIWYEWINRDKANKKFAYIDEHCVANRSIVFCKLIQTIHDSSNQFNLEYPVIIDLLLEHAEWLYQDEHYIYNNHGTMMDRALLLIAVKFSEEKIFFNKYQNKAFDRLTQMMTNSFGEDGINTENSPGYHIMNINLFESIIKFAKYYNLDKEYIENCSVILDKAREVTPFLLRNDKTTPPIGDTEVAQYLFVPEKFGVACFKSGGMAVVKTKDVYFSLKCGGSSFIHKHIDDTSITFRYLDEDIFIDGGFYNYDINDKIRRYFTSCFAHSGLFTSDFELLLFKNYTVEQLKFLAGIDFCDETPELVQIRCHNNLISNVCLMREIFLIYPNLLLIFDQASCLEEKDIFQHFLIHPNANIHVQGMTINGRQGKVDFSIKQFIKNEYQLQILNRWYSEKFMDKQDCKLIRFKATARQASFLTVIELHGLKQPAEIYNSHASFSDSCIKITYESFFPDQKSKLIKEINLKPSLLLNY